MVLKALFANARILVLSIYVVNEITPQASKGRCSKAQKNKKTGSIFDSLRKSGGFVKSR